MENAPQKQVTNRKPEWLKVRAPGGENYLAIKTALRERKLFTVCEEARCPNVAECWASGTATFMLLGDTCTRACKFCAVKTGNPLGWLDREEPQKVAESIALMKLKYAVLTTVDRDDLKDFGATHLASAIRTIRDRVTPPPVIEILSGDFRGKQQNLDILLEAKPEVFAHNIETTERLTPHVRDRRATFAQSLWSLEHAAKQQLITKTSIMLGMGETQDEVISAMQSVRDVGVRIFTLGQYLQPTPAHLPVSRYVHPDEFTFYKTEGLKMGFEFVASGPLVRSSYKASEHFIYRKIRGEDEQDLTGQTLT